MLQIWLKMCHIKNDLKKKTVLYVELGVTHR